VNEGVDGGRALELDPKTRFLLDRIALLPKVDPRTMPIDAYRAQIHAFLKLLPDQPPELAVVRDIAVEGAEGPLEARIYDSVDGAGRPTLVFFHGGGFVRGDIESHDPLCRRLAASGGFRVISVAYRLAPEAKFPRAPLDAIAAIRSIDRHAVTLGIDTARLAVGGDSAGANLAAVAAREFTISRDIQIRFQLLLYPVLQAGVETASRARFADGYMLTRESIAWLEDLYFCEEDEKQSPLASPLLHDVPRGIAPALIVTAGFDPLNDDGVAYAAKLSAAEVRCRHIDYGDQIHGFMSLTAFSDAAENAVMACAADVASALNRGAVNS
jgi:acetyl esterase